MKNRLVALGIAAALTVGGCAAKPDAPTSEPASPAATAALGGGPEGFEDYYQQPLDFEACDAAQVTDGWTAATDLKNYQCATASAPLDWDDPSSPPIELAVARYTPAGQGRDRPLLFFNLGGPGGDAIESFTAFNTAIAPPELLNSFDTIAVDPRGVGASAPVNCWDTKGREKLFAFDSPDWQQMDTDQIVAEATEELAWAGQSCVELSGDIVGFVDTDSAARDFDMVRALMGQETMDYLGFSYGTLLGATYAELFPDRVGRFVLDAALDPAYSINEVVALQAQGMEESLDDWIETCQAGPSCPLTGNLDSGRKQMIQFFEQVEVSPLPTDDPNRELTASLARTGVIGSLYSTESYPLLTMGMEMALDGDGSVLLTLADFYNGRRQDGTYSNMQDAFMAINALDYQMVGTPEEWQEEAEQLAAKYPVFGADFAFASAGMDAWPVPSRATRQPVTAVGTPEILVIGGTHDPATPYVMAETMAASLDKGVLITRDGWGHGSYQAGGSQCIQDVVTPFLLDGTVPPSGVVCTD